MSDPVEYALKKCDGFCSGDKWEEAVNHYRTVLAAKEKAEADVTSRGLEITRLRDELAEAKKYDRKREDLKSLHELLDFRTVERDKLRELVNAVKDPTEDGGYFKSIYCEDIEGVNWFDARDALKGGSKS